LINGGVTQSFIEAYISQIGKYIVEAAEEKAQNDTAHPGAGVGAGQENTTPEADVSTTEAAPKWILLDNYRKDRKSLDQF
jgi:hypothetical protein